MLMQGNDNSGRSAKVDDWVRNGEAKAFCGCAL